MKRWLLVAAIAFTLNLSSYVAVFAFETEMPPGEGKPGFAAQVDLVLHEKPSKHSPIVKEKKIVKGQKLNYIKTIYRTEKPGLAKVLVPFTSTARSYGIVEHLTKDLYYARGTKKMINLKRGDKIEYLQPRAEGEGFIRIDGEILAVDILVYEFQKKVEVTEKPVTQWWVHAADEKKIPLGWVSIGKETVKILKRSF